jgi:V/A-type H+-transporting ATPase subunit K
MTGLWLVLSGASLSAFLAGIGSAIGCGIVGRSAAGVTIEDPTKFGRLFLLQALPGTQGFYGLVGLFLTLQKLAIADVTKITIEQGLQTVFACLPVGIVGLISAIHQGLVCASGCSIVAKRPEEVGKAFIYGVMVETYAILGLVSTVLLLGNVKLG